MNVNARTCMTTMLKYSKPVEDVLEYLNRNGCESVPTHTFQLYVKDLLDSIELQLGASDSLKRVKFEIAESYDIRTLKNHGYIILDEGKNLMSLSDFVDTLFRHIVDKMLLKPIPERKFRQHENNLSVIINESKRFNSKSKLERDAEIEYIKEFLRTVELDFSSNLSAIETHSGNLSKLIESKETNYSKRDIMEEIVVLCDKYIEPFFRFLQTTNKARSGFISKLDKLQDFFEHEGFHYEANDINRFIIHFSKYIDEIKVIYDKINEYRRKGQQDLLVFNAFEQAFNALKESAESVLDGKTIKNSLESSNFHQSFSKLNGLMEGKKRQLGGINIRYIKKHPKEIENFLLLESNTAPTMTEVLLDDAALERMAKLQKERNKVTQRNNKNKMKITAIMHKYRTYLSAPSQDEDVMQKTYKVLKKHMPEDQLTGHMVLMAYFHLRNNQNKKVSTGFNRRRFFIDVAANVKYVYRPVFII
jgi:hypothetical protein